MIAELITNKILLSVVIAELIAQLTKVIITKIENKEIKLGFEDLIATGGMPSTHSTLVSSLSTIIYLLEGFSTSFFISLALAAVVLRDAMGVRRTVGEQGKALVLVMKKVKMPLIKMHPALGHSPLQILVGVLIGITTAIVVYYI